MVLLSPPSSPEHSSILFHPHQPSPPFRNRTLRMAPRTFSSLVSLVLFLAICSAKPICKSRSTVLSVSALLQIAPKSASCAGAPAGCFTASQALVPMANSFNRYGISSPGEIAALISLMAWESDDFHYQVPIAGNPGQGSKLSLPPCTLRKTLADMSF